MRDMRGILNNLSMPTLTWKVPQLLTKEDKCSDVVIALSLQQAPPPTHARQFWTGTHWNNRKTRIVEFRGWRSCSSLSCPRISPSSAYGLSPFPTIRAFLSSNGIFLLFTMVSVSDDDLYRMSIAHISHHCTFFFQASVLFSIENANFWLILVYFLVHFSRPK